jgi:tRNA U34 2-thiouridine synthase MnmA/TrmU
MGVCFIGKRDMKDFLLHYISKHANICRLIDITNGRVILSGRDAAHHMYDTLGQRARLGGMPIKYFVARKDASNGDIFLAPGSEHPSLYCNSVDIVYSDFNWIHGMFPSRLIPSTISLHEEAVIHCTCQYRHLQSGVSCSVRLMRKPKSSCSASPSSLSPLPLSTLLFSRYLTQPEIGQNVQVVGLSATSSKSTISIGQCQ